jgi:hypothetical protein
MICLDACSRLIAEVASTNQEIVTTNLHIYPLPRFLFNFFQTLIFVYGDNIYGGRLMHCYSDIRTVKYSSVRIFIKKQVSQGVSVSLGSGLCCLAGIISWQLLKHIKYSIRI